MAQLVAGRLVQGLGSGAMNVAIYVCVAVAFSRRQRPKMFTYISTAWVLPSFVGPPVSAWLTQHLSWHWVFFAVIPLVIFGGAMAFPSLLRMMRAHRPTDADDTKPAPMWAAGLLAVAAAMLQLAGQRLDWLAVGLAVGGVAGLLVALPPLMPPGFLRFRRGLPQVMQTRGLLAGAFFGAEAFVPLMLVEQRSVPLLQAGAVLTVGAIGWTVGSWLQSRPWLPHPARPADHAGLLLGRRRGGAGRPDRIPAGASVRLGRRRLDLLRSRDGACYVERIAWQ